MLWLDSKDTVTCMQRMYYLWKTKLMMDIWFKLLHICRVHWNISSRYTGTAVPELNLRASNPGSCLVFKMCSAKRCWGPRCYEAPPQCGSQPQWMRTTLPQSAGWHGTAASKFGRKNIKRGKRNPFPSGCEPSSDTAGNLPHNKIPKKIQQNQ